MQLECMISLTLCGVSEMCTSQETLFAPQ